MIVRVESSNMSYGIVSLNTVVISAVDVCCSVVFNTLVGCLCLVLYGLSC